MAEKDLKRLIIETKSRYDRIGKVWCEALGADVHFTSEGRNHLIYKSNRKRRPVKEQYYKLHLFPLVVPVLKGSAKIQECRFIDDEKGTQYYAISGVTGKHKTRIRIVIKRIGSGQFNYHSVMIDKKNRS